MKKTVIYLTYLSTFVISVLLLSQSCSATKNQVVTSNTAASSKEYAILNPGETILLYKYVHLAHSAKEADKYNSKFYFTTPSSDVLMELTKNNLKKAFATNHAFHDALDANFSKDQELINYDDFHKKYKVNWLLQNSQH